MPAGVKKWTLRIVVTIMFIIALLVGIVLKPTLLYAHSTVDGNYTICHQKDLDTSFVRQLRSANDLLRSSELYDSTLKLTVCLDDGSCYPVLMGKIRGAAFGWGFAHQVVLGCAVKSGDNYGEINGYKWNLTELLAHEAIHCLQFHHYGFAHSGFFGNKQEVWKWEGYPEYIARKHKADLCNNITRLLVAQKSESDKWIYFDDSTGTVIPYYHAWLLVQFCMDVRKMSFDQLLDDTTNERTVNDQMMAWYAGPY